MSWQSHYFHKGTKDSKYSQLSTKFQQNEQIVPQKLEITWRMTEMPVLGCKAARIIYSKDLLKTSSASFSKFPA